MNNDDLVEISRVLDNDDVAEVVASFHLMIADSFAAHGQATLQEEPETLWHQFFLAELKRVVESSDQYNPYGHFYEPAHKPYVDFLYQSLQTAFRERGLM